MAKGAQYPSCDHCADLMPFYVARTLPAEEMVAVRRHLATCVSCQRAAQEWRAVDGLVRADAQARARRLPPLPAPSFYCRRGVRRVERVGTAWPILAATLLFIALVAPAGAFRAAAEGIEGLVERLMIGRHTVVQRVEPERMAQMTPTLLATPASALTIARYDGALILCTPQGTPAHDPLDGGRSDVVQRFHSFEEARRAVPFRLLQPVRLPKGYALREALVTPLGRVLLFYDGPTGAITLMQLPVGQQDHGGAAGAVYADVEMLTDQPIQAFVMEGYQAAWIGAQTLMWERDGISIVLEGDGLTRDEATRLALSCG